MIIFGKNVLYELDKKLIKKVYVSRKDYLDYLQKNNIKYDMVDNYVLDKMVKGNHQGIVIETFDYQYKDIKDVSGNLVVILDHLSDPHNFGAIIRTCECMGVKSIIIPKDRSVLVNDTVYKTGVGDIRRILRDKYTIAD